MTQMYLIKKTKCISFVALSLFNLMAHAAIEGFQYNNTVIHPACLSLLATQLNGDNLVSRVNIDKVELKGCVNSNFAFSKIEEEKGSVHSKIEKDGKPISISYQVLKKLSNKTFVVKYTEEVEGSMGNSLEIMIVEIAKFKTIEVDNKDVKLYESIGLVKLGRIANEQSLENQETIRKINKEIK